MICDPKPFRRTWSVGLRLPTFNANGTYSLYGTIPPNFDLDRSTGDGRLDKKIQETVDHFYIFTFTYCNGRLAGKKVDFTLVMRLGVREGGKIEITSSDLNVELKDIHAELECLFPRRGKCCPRKYLKSCNTILAKTVLR